jgi:RNA polymerase sigma-70 factor (ECF subfamily)
MLKSSHTPDEQRWAAFEVEALPHAERLFRHAMWLERNRAEAEDLVQETLMHALQSFHRYRPGSNCRAWLMTILHHRRTDRLRAKDRLTFVSDVENQIAETVPSVPAVPEHLTDEDVLSALNTIPDRYQHVILLCDIEELTYKEAADALSIPIGTVMSRLHRGRAELAEQLRASDRSKTGTLWTAVK